MKIHYLQHVPFEGPGYIANWAQDNACTLSCTQLFKTTVFPSLEDFDWLIIMGGPMSIHDADAFPWLIQEKEFIKRVINSGKRVLGICLGAQLIADAFDADVYQHPQKEIGWFPIEPVKTTNHTMKTVFPGSIEAFHWHGETFAIPKGASHIAKSTACANQAFILNKVIGLQFHLESTPDTVRDLIKNCSHEIVEAPYIQTANEMLNDEKRFHSINKLMKDVLNYQLNLY